MLTIRIDEKPEALPFYLQIKLQICDQIRSGALPAGTRLPSSRGLAHQLQIARCSVVRAYEELCQEGLCTSGVGIGTLVCEHQNQPDMAGQTDTQASTLQVPDEPLNSGSGLISLLPSLATTEYLPKSELRKGFDRVLRYSSRLTAFNESAGDHRLRQLICEKLLPERSIRAQPQNVLIVPGTQYGSMLIALTLNKHRPDLHFGEPGYLDIARNFSRFGFSLKAHPMDNNGIILDSQLGKNDVLYLMPEHHFPQCITLSEKRRQEISHQLVNNGLMLIEDDYDSEFYYERMPLPALKSQQGHENIIYSGTFSKTLFNSLRLGYLVAEADLIQEMASLHWSLSRGTSGLLQHWVAELLAAGTLTKHTQRMRTVYQRKRDKVAELLAHRCPEWQFDVPKGGLQFFVNVGSPEMADQIIAKCRDMNIRMAHPSNYVLHDKSLMNFIIIGFGSASLSDIEKSIEELLL